MRRTLAVGLVLALAAVGAPAALRAEGDPGSAPPAAVASPPPVPPHPASLDTLRVTARLAPWNRRPVGLLALPPQGPGSETGPLAAPRLPGPRLHTVRLSRFATTAYGADRGANAGLFLGGIGNLIGAWDEKTAFYLMGAGAALGAIWGGTAGADDPAFNVRVTADDR
jgi:hypothetical protein